MRASRGVRVGVPGQLLALAPAGGHGKGWHRVLSVLSGTVPIVSVGPGRDRSPGRARRLQLRQPTVVLADGHADLPITRAPLVVQVHEAGWFEAQLREALTPEFYDYISVRTEQAVRAAAHVITPSEAARRHLLREYRLEPDRVHAVGITASTRSSSPVPRAGARSSRARDGRDAP